MNDRRAGLLEDGVPLRRVGGNGGQLAAVMGRPAPITNQPAAQPAPAVEEQPGEPRPAAGPVGEERPNGRRLLRRVPFGHPVPPDDFLAVERLRLEVERRRGRRVTNNEVVAAAMRLLPVSYPRAAAEMVRLDRGDPPLGRGAGRKLTASDAPEEWRQRLAYLQVEGHADGVDISQQAWFRLALRLLVEAGPEAFAEG